jgi:drug/metabolite transporter (DMT)-like permease
LISINALFLPLVCLLVASVVWVALNRWLRRRIDEDRGPAANVRAVGIAALFSALVVVISLLPAILEPARTALLPRV